MKNLEQHIRNLARGERASVDAQHVAGFEQYLKDRKRGRRGLFVLWVVGLTALVATGIVLSVIFSADTPDITSKSVTSSQHVAKPAIDHAAIAASTVSPEIPEGSSEVARSPESATTPTPTPNSNAQGRPARAGESSRKASANRSTATLTAELAAILPPASLTPESQKQIAGIEATDQMYIMSSAEGFRPSFITTDLAYHPAQLHPIPGRGIDRAEPKFATRPRFHLGATGTWFVHNPDNVVGGNGMVFQGGLFATYALSPRIYVRFDGGFSLLDGAVYFKKEASQQELLFRAQSRMSVLEAQQLYAYHGGLSLMYRMGRHQVSLGAQAFHVYGARGNVERISEGSDGTTMTERLNDTWVATSGLKRNPVDILGGYHYTFSDLLEISMTARIPVNEFGTVRTRDEGYLYSSEAYGVVPQVGLSYFIR